MKASFRVFVLLTATCFFSFQSVAGEFSCPETHPEYNKVIDELQAFKKKLSEELECQEIAVNFEKLTNLLGKKSRGDILSIVTEKSGGSVSADNAKKIQDYASAVTSEVGVLVELISKAANGEGSIFNIFGGTDKCSMDEEDELEGIERLTKAAYEATNLISKVAGPYGVPLQVAVNTAYGVVQGLQSYSKRAQHIDFDKFEKRQFFESAICIMSKFDADVRKLNNPEAHLNNLENAKEDALREMRSVKSKCDNCDSIFEAESSDEARAKLQSMSSSSDENYTLSAEAYTSRADLEWINGEINKFRNLVNFKTGGVGPRELQVLKREINTYMLKTAAPDFLKWYTKKATYNNVKFNKAIDLALKEIKLEFKENGKKFSKRLPEKIERKYEDQRHSLGKVTADSVRFSSVLRAPELTSLYYISNNLPETNGLPISYYSALGEAYDVWKLSDLNIRVVQEYCSFFEDTLQYPKVIEKRCEGQRYIWYALRSGYQSFYLANLINENSIMDRRGPYDFRLDTYYNFIDKNENLHVDTEGYLTLAREGLDLLDVLQKDMDIKALYNRTGGFRLDQDLPGDRDQDRADEFLLEH